MNDPSFKSSAWLIAENTPEHLGKSTLPPQGWRVEGAELVVLLADGRKVRGPISPVRTVVPAIKQPVTVTDLPVRISAFPKGKKK